MNLTQNSDVMNQDIYTPAFGINIENISMNELFLKTVTRVSVDQYTNKPASFSLQVNDSNFGSSNEMQELLAEGRQIEIFMGYAQAMQSLIKGEIVAIGFELDESGGFILTVEGFDRLHAATRGSVFEKFEEKQTDRDIVRKVAKSLHLNATVDHIEPRQGDQIQNQENNLELLEYLARMNGFFFWVEGDTLFFKKNPVESKVVLTRGKNLTSLSARLSTSGQVDTIEVRGWDAAQKKAFSARAKSNHSRAFVSRLVPTGQMQISGLAGASSERIIYADGKVRTIAEAQAMADAEMAEQRRALLTAEGSAIGNPDIRPGSIVDLENMGRFSGEYVVEKAQHMIDQSGYRTSFSIRQHL
ncbi:MAG: phage late control D family protein [Nitrosomonas sp.]|nr:phage late control D family protein [Nitrosomonas sp.]